MGRTVIVTGTGNNGSQPWHAGGILQQGKTEEIQLAVGAFEPTLNVQLWKDYEDEMEIYLESPSGEQIGPLYERLGPQRHLLENTELLIYYGKPGPYQLSQEIYIDFIPEGNYVDSGVWKVLLSGKHVRSGQYFLWLPGGNVLNRGTGFYSPRAVGTLTIPSTAGKVISVGAYDSRQNAYADFSGRGSQFLPIRKPDLAAPGVSISAPVPGGGYATVTGTSFAAPFVSGSAALLMEWGIVKGNDPFLYGEKVKAYLRKGAQSVGGYEEYPNVDISNEGEKDFIIEYIPNPEKPKWINALKTVALCVVIFFGAAFTIMAFNNDVSVGDVFSKFYRQVMGKESSGVTELEICYSIGLAIGITLFFNHVGSKKITPDPTPMQVEMRKYEKDIDTTFIENAERKGHSIDVN